MNDQKNNYLKIKLQAKYWDKVLDGSKFSTSRLGKRDYPLGFTVIEQTENPDISIVVYIRSIEYCRFGELTNYEAVAEGYYDAEDLKANLCKIYGNIEYDDIITLLHWELPKHNPQSYDALCYYAMVKSIFNKVDKKYMEEILNNE